MNQNDEEDRLTLRLPRGFKKTIKISAAENDRTINAELLYHLRRAYGVENEKSGTTA